MLTGTSKYISPAIQYQILKNSITSFITNGNLKTEEYKALLTELSPTKLRLNIRGSTTILWWVVYAAYCGKPRLFIDVWNAHKGQLTHFDFCSVQGTQGSPLWYLAEMSKSEPQYIAAYFLHFSNHIKVESIIETLRIDEYYHVSVLGLIANMAVSHPKTFEEIWPVIKNDLNATILTKKQLIAGATKTPIQSLLEATLIPKPTEKSHESGLDASIIHFCFEQFGDLRPGFQAEYIVPGSIVRRATDSTVKVVDLPGLQFHKNAFFDELMRINTTRATFTYDTVIALARAALEAGFLNPGYHLAQHFKEQSNLDLLHEALITLPEGSKYQQYALKKCASWFLSKAAIELNVDKQLKYLTKALASSLKLTDALSRSNLLHRTTYLYVYGKELPVSETTSVKFDFLDGVNEKTTLKTLMFALARCKYLLNQVPQTTDNKSFRASEQAQVEPQQYQPLPKPVIPRMGAADGYTFDPTPALFHLYVIDHDCYGIGPTLETIKPLTVAEASEFENLSSLMDMQEAMFLMNPAIPYVRSQRPQATPITDIETITRPVLALPLTRELADIDPLRKPPYKFSN